MSKQQHEPAAVVIEPKAPAADDPLVKALQILAEAGRRYREARERGDAVVEIVPTKTRAGK